MTFEFSRAFGIRMRRCAGKTTITGGETMAKTARAAKNGKAPHDAAALAVTHLVADAPAVGTNTRRAANNPAGRPARRKSNAAIILRLALLLTALAMAASPACRLARPPAPRW